MSARITWAITVLLCCTWPAAMYGQSALLRKADALHAEFAYVQAIPLYERAFTKGLEDLEAARKLAECYRQVRDLPSSEKWYGLIAAGPGAKPEDLFHYADALRSNARYALADSVLGVYAEQRPDDGRAQRLMNSASLQPWLLMEPLLEGNANPVPWNSEELDISPNFLGGSLVFASSRVRHGGADRKNAWDGLPFLDLYTLEGEKASPMKGSVNTRYNESNATFSPDGKEMYFTRNSYHGGRTQKGEDGFANLMIYRAELVDGAWTNESPFPYNDPAWSTAHPSLNHDATVLYFSSNRPGGRGGADLWRCRRNGEGSWDAPENLGPKVNTEGNELFPVAQGPYTLFFASDGHAGLGGLDVFLTRAVLNDFRTPLNVGAPVNSRMDDLGLVLHPSGTYGYFCSDRSATGRTNIFRLDLDQPFVEQKHFSGVLVSAVDGMPMEHLSIRILDIQRNVIATSVSGADGRFEFFLDEEPAMISIENVGPREILLIYDDLSIPLTDIDFELAPILIPDIVVFPLVVQVTDSLTLLPLANMEVRIVDRRDTTTSAAAGTTGTDGARRMYLRTADKVSDVFIDAYVTAPSGAVARSQHVLPIRGKTELALQLFHHVRPQGTDKRNGKRSRVTRGRVVDRTDGLPLVSLPVDVLDAQKQVLGNGLTDKAGNYSIHTTEEPSFVQIHIAGTEAEIWPITDGSAAQDLSVNGRMDLPVNTAITDRTTGNPLPGVRVEVADRRTGTVLLDGTTDANGILRGTIPDRRYGNEENLRITFTREGYVPHTEHVDFTVLTFLEFSLAGLEKPKMTRYSDGVDLAGTLTLPTIHFDYNDARIRPDAENHLARVAQVLLADPSLRVHLRAHTDSRGGHAFNRFLSQRRAQNARAYLISQGIAQHRLIASGLGESELLNGCTDDVPCSEEDHQRNRRIEFIATRVRTGK